MRRLWFSTSSSLGFLTAVYYKINSACRPELAEDFAPTIPHPWTNTNCPQLLVLDWPVRMISTN
jgi:hypothetical protein